ncbi:MAG TPA: response regulator transcription factor [Pseudomonas sabulinigri]|uniref:DNA-binding response regulator n=1 Tax=marine sediment metagenome TaxID=412755 RepID=A0A0F9XWT6_9ZZZZ|nr:response regulator transcription factor [Halopseudomonas sabulinigri]HEC52727.1 response regulator transcription factor [Halopseudomonas sabulinigri]|tara:strand:+ start:725 stop:1426 length:702 start_codon:yes stop_codon:yes gene_type:complete
MLAHNAHSILTIEDDPVLGAHLKTSLESQGFEVTLATDGNLGLSLARGGQFDLILLDVMLPGLGGLEVLTSLRHQRRTPVLMMSALGDEGSRIQGFDCGADDYLPKPFSFAELQVRMVAILRRVAYEQRGQPAPQDPLHGFDDNRSDLQHDGRWMELTPSEYRLLKLLHDNVGEVQSKPFLYQQVLHRGYSQHDRGLDMHVSNIRRKLARGEVTCWRLESVWGQGYVLREQLN